MAQWNFNDLYTGFDETYQSDLKQTESLIDDYIAFIRQGASDPVFFDEGYLRGSEAMIFHLLG